MSRESWTEDGLREKYYEAEEAERQSCTVMLTATIMVTGVMIGDNDDNDDIINRATERFLKYGCKDDITIESVGFWEPDGEDP